MDTPCSCNSGASTSSSSSPTGSGDGDGQGAFSPRFGLEQDHDLILRSCDDVLFGVHRARLAGSSVFRDMFDLGEIYRAGHHAHQHRGSSPQCEVPTVTLTEPAATLEDILPFFYGDFVDVDSLPFDSVIAAFEASAKYGMSLPEHIFTARLRRVERFTQSLTQYTHLSLQTYAQGRCVYGRRSFRIMAPVSRSR